MKKRFIVVILISIAVILISIGIGILATNKTFFKTTYVGVHNQEIFIPKYSLFRNESGYFCASFVSLKSEKKLQEEINNYMEDFTYFEDEYILGYKKENLYISSYVVVNEGLYRKIYITYNIS